MLKEENYPHLENSKDFFWLSKFIVVQSSGIEKVQDKKEQEPSSTPELEEDEPNIELEEEEEQEDDLEVHTDNQEDNSKSSSMQKSANAIKSPKKLALDHYREWEKAFKFINLKTASKNRYELNEEKTVENIASTKVFDLRFKRVEEKSFFLTLVIDQGETMELWSELIKNFEQMLMTMGVFVRVSLFYWDTKNEKPLLYVDKTLKREVSEKVIVTDGQRNLVWVMSDCIAPAWKSGEAFKSIDRWATKSFTSILQMFPKEMWMGTMLFNKHIRLSSHSFNPINKKLQIKPSKRGKEVLKIPVISFDPYALQAWAKVVVNSKENSISGIELDSLDFEPLKTPLKKDITPDMRMQRFYSQASPTAQKLAFYMSVLPIDFQVTRILQEEKLSKSKQSHVAEVFLGGLIERKKKAKDIYYDFYPKVREELNANISADESFEIMADMSNFVSSHLGIGFDFKALLADPNGAFEGEFALSEESLAYAKLASGVLKRKGGEFYGIAKKIDNLSKNILLEVNEKIKNKIVIPTSKRFIMGSEDGRDNEKPAHEVTINYDFEISSTPVTVGEFRVFVEETEYKTEAEMGDGSWIYDYEKKEVIKKEDVYWDNLNFEQTDDHPVVCVSWNDAQAYIKWLNEKTGETYRLPTEAEWEFSCRAGSTTKWHFGDDKSQLEEYAWYDEKDAKCTKKVATKKPNQWGLYDMHGNVWEWCLDDFEDNYNNIPVNGSEHILEEKKYKSLRGGSWVSYASDTRSSYRNWDYPTGRSDSWGFRLLRTLP